MTGVDETLAVLRALVVEGSTLELFAVSREVEQAPVVTRVLLGASLDLAFREAAVARAHDWGDRIGRPWAPSALVGPGEVMHLTTIAGLLAGLQDTVTTGDVEPYDPRSGAEHLAMLTARLSTAAGVAVTFWRQLRPTMRLERARLLPALWTGDRYVRLEQEHVLLLDGRFDAVVVGGVALFTGKAVFEKMFDLVAELRRSSAATFASVTRDLRIEGLAQLETACTSQPAMMAKLASVQRRLDSDPGYREAMTMDRVVEFVLAHPETEVEVLGTGADARLVFRSDHRRYKILKLLDDDYLHSLLTRRSYEANDKSGPL